MLAIYAGLFSFFFVIVMAVAFMFVRPLDFVFGYILVAAACALYNLGFRFIGALEFEAKTSDTERNP